MRCYIIGITNLQGKTLIVTGVTGVGGAIARQAAARGANVVAATSDELAGMELTADTGAVCWTGELKATGAAESLLALAISRFARVDGLVNVAGMSGRRFGDGPVHEIEDEGWETALAANLQVTFRMCRAVLSRMMVQTRDEFGQRGAIVSIGSVFVESPESKHFAAHGYAAAKGAIAAMSRSMASYYAPHGIRVNVVAPAVAATPAAQASQDDREWQELIKRRQPAAGGPIPVDDIASAALYLLGANSITGEMLTIDAGWRLTGA